MQEWIGRRVGAYELQAWLGEGAHVHAFLATDATGRRVVIKILKSSFASTPELIERFHREAQAALDLKHPNIVELYEYAQQDDLLYLVEEFMPGGSLRDILWSDSDEPIPLSKIVRTAEDIASALDFAHARGILHRDLKPENILYRADGGAALSDLGITKTLDRKAARTREALKFANPGYMAPEIWQGGEFDVRADNYALGIILFEMLTRQLPFHAEHTGSMMYIHLMHLLAAPLSLRELRPDLPAALDTVLARAIDKNPDHRYATAGELAAAFRDALGSAWGGAAPAVPPGSAPAVTVRLVELTDENWRPFSELRVRDDQRDFVADNLVSIAESRFHPTWTPLGIVAGEEPVGFALIDQVSESAWEITRLMIDADHQGKGYGRAATQQLIAMLSAKPGIRTIQLSYVPGNDAAVKLYTSLGFRDTGQIVDGERVMVYAVP